MSEQWQFEVGDTGKTRDGQAYRVICLDRKSTIGPGEEFSLVVLLLSGAYERAGYRRADGRYLSKGECGEDLMPPDRVLAERGGLR